MINISITANYYPHVTTNPNTLAPGKVSLQKTAGANVTSSVFMSSLSVGIAKDFELGTIPLLYLESRHQYNFNFKYNLYKNDFTSISIGFTRMSFNIDDYQAQDNFIINMTSLITSFNIYTGIAIGFTFNRDSSYTKKERLQSYRSGDEFSLDIIYEINSDYIVSTGIGEYQMNLAATGTDTIFGYGASITVIREKKLLSSPSLGLHYLPKNKGFLYLFTTSFY
ncbi:hypothetical protein [Bacteriovorax sp. Seq25_V]|uniref:hypothetical protein n=1 Tax=Bacteriovorax sp. Seq25_V TaxID=1201288 RepID=UPI000389EDDF|nr:hypothetical protein [Bacteriovorax sp. Seq25_V]EQC44314.1 hypothetical protein M900_A0441 [Bacteriovorax sp. Seq25_V]